MFLKSYNTS